MGIVVLPEEVVVNFVNAIRRDLYERMVVALCMEKGALRTTNSGMVFILMLFHVLFKNLSLLRW